MKEAGMGIDGPVRYDDGQITCGDDSIVIGRYYLWGAKRILYSSIRSIEGLPLTGLSKIRKWRLWGSGDFVHWWNLDMSRPKKDLAIVIDVGRRVRPTITPDEPEAVMAILTNHLGGNDKGR